MANLLDLCYDVLSQITEELEPADLAACAQTSKGFNLFTKENKRLYKAIYLDHFDDPRLRLKPTDPEPDWVNELKDIIRCQKILQSANNDVKGAEFDFVVNTVLRLVGAASMTSGASRNKNAIADLFEFISQNCNAFMYRSSLYKSSGTRVQRPADNEEDRQLSAKLHCLFGISSSSTGRRSLSIHPWARSRVYDLRNYTEKTQWGPFRRDGSMRADWQFIECLMLDLAFSSGICCQRYVHRFRPPWTNAFEGVIPDHSTLAEMANPMPLLNEPDIPLHLKDPYDVAGTWSRIVCFLDYTDFYAFNFGSAADAFAPDQPRDPLDVEEAIRHIIMHLKVTDITPAGPDDNPDMPVVHFAGKSRSIEALWDPNANSKIRGTVSLTPEGEVRWRTISIFFGGEERWASDGIQVGGLRSKRGVIGTWFDKDFDVHGPAGPTAFWKIGPRSAATEEEATEVEENQ